ncbi:MAG: Gfo/Idh/MocA family oxidoreductase [Herpetosiphonaceae bacterium]|nr:Gfo/Idh/MocA family oxidoreductase [Herpetosiphonaceae bacterium]
MAKSYRVGVIGFAHMHINALVDAFAKLPNVEWVACADTVPSIPSHTEKSSSRRANLKRAHEVTGIPKVYDDYHQMLDQEQMDIVIFCPENARHAEIAEAVAAKGIHMVTEKPMADSLSDALRMVRAAQTNNVRLMINWPITWSPATRTMKKLIDSGIIGDVWEIKWRNGASMGPLSYGKDADAFTDEEKGTEWWHHSAPGGGALLDYCCYGACVSRWYLGTPAIAATALKANLASPYGDADDNAVITVRFPKALAILEGTWTTFHTGIPTGPIVYGTKGTMVTVQRQHRDHALPTSAVEVYTTRSHDPTPPDQVVDGEPLPVGRATLAEEFIHHLETGEALHPTLDPLMNLEMMAILDAGIRSAASGKVELINDATWNIG